MLALPVSTAGDEFQSTTIATIPVGGSIDVVFQAVNSGAIICLAGTLTTIQSGIVGWNSITNATDGVEGNAQQTDSNLRLFRSNTLSSQAVQTTNAIISALYNVSGVLSLSFRENVESTTQIIDTITLVPHSIWACVYGGTDANIAQAIIDNRSAGSNFNGSVSVPITVSSGQIINVLFDRPAVITMLVRITVKLTSTSSVTASLIQQTIYDYANGNIAGEPGFVVGSNVSPFEIASNVAILGGVYVQLVEIAPSSTAIYQSTEYAIAINEIASIPSTSAVQVIIV